MTTLSEPDSFEKKMKALGRLLTPVEKQNETLRLVLLGSHAQMSQGLVNLLQVQWVQKKQRLLPPRHEDTKKEI